MTLIYKGNGRYIVGVPARDLTEDEIEGFANLTGRDPVELAQELTGSGLYELEKQKRSGKKTAEPESTDSEDDD